MFAARICLMGIYENTISISIAFGGSYKRYYNSSLSIWLSVDPMSDKYPSTSPYTYCGNNPVKLVDPNGEDWFENENTGDIMYVRDFRIKDASKLGDGWNWMGRNGMFGASDNEVIRSNLTEDQAYLVNNYNDIISTSYSGSKAESFMDKMGYEKKPLLQDVKSKEITQIMPDAMGPASFEFTEKIETVEKTHSYTYALKGSVASYEIQGYYKKSTYEQQPFLNKRTITDFERRQYSYVRPTLGNSIRPIIDPIIRVFGKMF